jgi:hypothetical protein
MSPPPAPIPGKPEEPVANLVGRWMMIGCLVTLAVLVMAGAAGAWVMMSGLMGDR